MQLRKPRSPLSAIYKERTRGAAFVIQFDFKVLTGDDVYRAQLWEILSALAFRSGLLAGVTPSHRSIPMGTWDGKRSLGGEGEERGEDMSQQEKGRFCCVGCLSAL